MRPLLIIFKTARDYVSGVIKEIDEDFLVPEKQDGSGLTAIIDWRRLLVSEFPGPVKAEEVA